MKYVKLKKIFCNKTLQIICQFKYLSQLFYKVCLNHSIKIKLLFASFRANLSTISLYLFPLCDFTQI